MANNSVQATLDSAPDARRSSINMILRTDTIGHFKRPTEKNIRAAILYPGENVRENDLVKLMINEDSYICVWIGKRENGHLLELRFRSNKVTCRKRLSSEDAIQIMIKYLHGDISWFNEFSWDKSISQKLLKNLQILAELKG
jgi:hypothetical protein